MAVASFKFVPRSHEGDFCGRSAQIDEISDAYCRRAIERGQLLVKKDVIPDISKMRLEETKESLGKVLRRSINLGVPKMRPLQN